MSTNDMPADTANTTPTRSSREIETADEKINLPTPSKRAHLKPWQWPLTCVGIMLGAFLYGLDTTIAADVQSAVYDTFHDIENLPWLGIGFVMASVATVLPIGRFYGVYNIKFVYLSSLVTFEVGSALCGAAPNSAALVVGRVIAGVGGSGIYLGALNYIAVHCDVKEIAIMNASTGLGWGVGAILGPVIGGAFSVSNATWRWAFYINLPIAAICAPIYIFAFPSWSAEPTVPISKKVKDFDWVGTVLNGAVYALLMIALTFCGPTYPWNSGAAIALWVIWAVTLIAFVLQQSFSIFTTPERRIFPVHMLKCFDMILLYIASAANAATFGITLYYIPLFFAFSRGDSALESAVRLLPYIILFIASIMVTGATLPIVGRYFIYYTLGAALVLVGAALMFTIRADTPIANVYGYEVLIGLGSGLAFQNAYAVVASKMDPQDQAAGLGLMNVAQIGGLTIALSVAASLFENLGFQYLKSALAPYGIPDAVLYAALAGTNSPVFSTLAPEVTAVVVSTVAYTISRLMAMGIAAAALQFVVSLVMKKERLNLTGGAAM